MGEETRTVLLYSAGIMLSLLFFAVIFWLGWRMSKSERAVSPYTGVPLRRLTEVSFYSAERILLYVYNLQQYDNRIFKLKNSAFCRETGRIFQDCVNIFDNIKVDWTFLQKRYQGNWVSWGSLSKELKESIEKSHASMDKFQTFHSSPNPSPRAIEPEYAYAKPGPLYVDIDTKILLGWQIVPGTEFEVLIVQKPIS